jgi:hypothetical protein
VKEIPDQKQVVDVPSEGFDRARQLSEYVIHHSVFDHVREASGIWDAKSAVELRHQPKQNRQDLAKIRDSPLNRDSPDRLQNADHNTQQRRRVLLDRHYSAPMTEQHLLS